MKEKSYLKYAWCVISYYEDNGVYSKLIKDKIKEIYKKIEISLNDLNLLNILINSTVENSGFKISKLDVIVFEDNGYLTIKECKKRIFTELKENID